jgi:hypothetical protein
MSAWRKASTSPCAIARSGSNCTFFGGALVFLGGGGGGLQPTKAVIIYVVAKISTTRKRSRYTPCLVEKWPEFMLCIYNRFCGLTSKLGQKLFLLSGFTDLLHTGHHGGIHGTFIPWT